MGLHVEKVVDEAGAATWHAISEVAVPFDHPGLLADPLEEVVGLLSGGSSYQMKTFYVAYADGEAAAIGMTELPMVDNLRFASIEIIVPPRLRRRGYGRQMFEFLREQCRVAGRCVIAGRVGAPFDGTSAGEWFAKAVGARLVLEEMRSELKLATIDRDALHRLEEQASSCSRNYELLQWTDHAPEDLLDDAARLWGNFLTEAPMGGLSVEAERWDAARIRDSERETIARGRMRAATAARHVVTNRLVAITEIAIPSSRPSIAYQWATLVERDHRGHRLGLRIKIANLRLLTGSLDAVETVQTWTATENAPMIAINRAIGFDAVERFEEWQAEI